MERLRTECMLCILEKQIEKIPKDINEAKKREFLQRMFGVLSNAPLNAGAPLLVREIKNIKKEMFGLEDDFEEVKVYFNHIMMGYEGEIRQRIEHSEDSLKAAIQFALAGNFIDFGAMKNVDEMRLKSLLFSANDIVIDPICYENLKEDLAKAKKLLYITDNCGEIVMDKLVIEDLKKQFPELSITVFVRSKSVLNDATLEDAKQVGLTECVEVCGSGSDLAGTCIETLPVETYEILDSADIIIAKGQGNFETMRYCGRNVYYMFLCKCALFADCFKVPKFTGIVINDQMLL